MGSARYDAKMLFRRPVGGSFDNFTEFCNTESLLFFRQKNDKNLYVFNIKKWMEST